MTDQNKLDVFDEELDEKVSFSYRFWRFLGRLLIYVILASWGFIAIVPFFWMLSTSVMTLGEAINGEFVTSHKLLERFEMTDEELGTTLEEEIPAFVRDNDMLSPGELKMTASEYAEKQDAYLPLGKSVYRGGMINYVIAWREAEFNEYVINSVQITLITLSGELFLSILAAYAFARMEWPGRDFIFGVLLSTIMIPGMVTIIPNFITVTWLGRLSPIPWMNNWPSLTIPFMGSVFAIFLLRQFFSQVPKDLHDAALMDGASHWTFLWRVVMPLSMAPVLVITVLSFIGTWNALAWPLLVTNTPEWRPIAVGLYSFVTQDAGSEFNLQMAGSVITIIPILLLYFVTQKQFTESIARTGMKG